MRFLALLTLFPALTHGQTLTPDRFTTTPTTPIALSYPSSAASTFPAAPSWFFIRLAGTQENRDASNTPAATRDGTLSLTLPLAGVALMGLDLAPQTSQWTLDVLHAFALSTGHADLCPTAAATVEHRISAATLVRVTTDSGEARPDATATSKSGLAAEIRPLMDPTTLGVGSDLPLRLYVDGEAVADARITASHAATATTRSASTDARGIASIRIDHPGPWTLEFHTLTPLTDPADPHPRWRAASASLTFSAPVALPPADAAPQGATP